MYLVGGCRNERYFSDVMVLNLKLLTWSILSPFPVSTAGHRLVATDEALFALVGVPTDEKLRVYKLETCSWSAVKTSGSIPASTCGHSATLIREDIWVVGGEDFQGQLHGEVHRLDLGSMTCGTIPPPRSCALHKDDHLYIFGGRTSSDSPGGLYRLDTAKMLWSREDCALSRASFGNAVIGDRCFVVGGTGCVAGTLFLNMETLKWTVVLLDVRLALEGVSLVHAVVKGEDHLIAYGQLGLFVLNVSRAPARYQQEVCLVRHENGSAAVVRVPRKGTPAEGLEAGTTAGYLERGGRRVSGELIYPGQEILFRKQPSEWKMRYNLDLMDASACKAFISALKINVITGDGWLEPVREIAAPAFEWKPSSNPEDQLPYLESSASLTHGVRLLSDYDTTPETVTNLSNDPPYKLEFHVKLIIRYMCSNLVSTGFWVEREVSETCFWRALVALLALNIKNHALKPWMVITDLKDEWHLAWMDGSTMFVSKAFGRDQALGILYDLGGEYDMVTTPLVYGNLSGKLPNVFSRKDVNLFCDEVEDEVPHGLLRRSPEKAGIIRIATGDGKFSWAMKRKDSVLPRMIFGEYEKYVRDRIAEQAADKLRA